MKKIAFSDKYGLTQEVIEGFKTMTRRIEHYKYPRYKLNEVVAIAQSYSTVNLMQGVTGREFRYRYENHKGWNNKMYVRADIMPHRIIITDIIKKKLQDITEYECYREGIFSNWPEKDTFTFNGAGKSYETPQLAFRDLIDSISGKGTWDNNPFVFVYTFKLIK